VVQIRDQWPVRRRAVPGSALYPEFFSEGVRLRSVRGGRALYPGSALSGKNMHCSDGLCPKGLREKSVKGGKALYPGSVIFESHCILIKKESFWRMLYLF